MSVKQSIGIALHTIGRFWLRYYLLVLLVLASVQVIGLQKRFQKGLIWSDAEGYYLYLPALFIHGGFEGLPVRTEAQFPIYEDTGKRFTKYTYGVALMQAPFFLGAHGLALATGRTADGYSHYYIRALQIAGLCYGFLGLLLLQIVLSRNFRPLIVMFTVIGLFLGTNLYHYTLQEPGMSHVYSFFLFGLFVWLTPRFYEQPDWRRFGAMGLLAGLIVLIRPTNIVLLLYLLLYGLRSWGDVRARLAFFQQHLVWIGLAAVASFTVFLPQFAYWRYISGDWLIYSYGDEGFNWLKPRIDMVLFHIKNGWLLFSPMAGFAVLGGLLGSWKNRYDIAPIFLIWALTLYLTASWWSWWFGGAFGHRNFVEYYFLLAIPYAWLFAQVFESRWLALKGLVATVWLALIYYSMVLAYQFNGPHYEWWSWRAALQAALPFPI